VSATAITTAEARFRPRGFITAVLPFDASTGFEAIEPRRNRPSNATRDDPHSNDSPNRFLFRREIGGMSGLKRKPSEWTSADD
jgi:hypothetical protein